MQDNCVTITIKGGINMDHNSSIGCIVSECKFHCKDDDYCTLGKIEVVKHTPTAVSVESTDCGSFKKS